MLFRCSEGQDALDPRLRGDDGERRATQERGSILDGGKRPSAPSHAENNLRVDARATLLPVLRERLANMPVETVMCKFEEQGLPFAPIARPHELFDDPHLNASGGLVPVRVGEGAEQSLSKVPLLPITLAGERPGLRLQPPRLGEHTDELLASLGYSSEQIADLKARSVAASNRFQAEEE